MHIMEVIASIVETVNKFLWDYALLILLLGTIIIYTFSLKFIQVREFVPCSKKMFGNFSLHGKSGENGLSSFQALATAIAAQVGTWKHSGCSNSHCIGRSRSHLLDVGQRLFRNGNDLCGSSDGAAYKGKKRKRSHCRRTGDYIKSIFKGKFGKFLAGFFSVAIILALGFMEIWCSPIPLEAPSKMPLA